MRTAYEQVTEIGTLPAQLTRLAARTVVLDVEPLVANWDSSQQELDQGVAATIALLDAVPAIEVVCFATNSARLPSASPEGARFRVEYLVSARKPLQIEPFRSWPRPGVVVGDQVATDGLLARRLGYTFVHFRPRRRDTPLGPLLLSGSGDLVRPLLFSTGGGNRRARTTRPSPFDERPDFGPARRT